jgi:hypothetical protein
MTFDTVSPWDAKKTIHCKQSGSRKTRSAGGVRPRVTGARSEARGTVSLSRREKSHRTDGKLQPMSAARFELGVVA